MKIKTDYFEMLDASEPKCHCGVYFCGHSKGTGTANPMQNKTYVTLTSQMAQRRDKMCWIKRARGVACG